MFSKILCVYIWKPEIWAQSDGGVISTSGSSYVSTTTFSHKNCVIGCGADSGHNIRNEGDNILIIFLSSATQCHSRAFVDGSESFVVRPYSN